MINNKILSLVTKFVINDKMSVSVEFVVDIKIILCCSLSRLFLVMSTQLNAKLLLLQHMHVLWLNLSLS